MGSGAGQLQPSDRAQARLCGSLSQPWHHAPGTQTMGSGAGELCPRARAQGGPEMAVRELAAREDVFMRLDGRGERGNTPGVEDRTRGKGRTAICRTAARRLRSAAAACG